MRQTIVLTREEVVQLLGSEVDEPTCVEWRIRLDTIPSIASVEIAYEDGDIRHSGRSLVSELGRRIFGDERGVKAVWSFRDGTPLELTLMRSGDIYDLPV